MQLVSLILQDCVRMWNKHPANWRDVLFVGGLFCLPSPVVLEHDTGRPRGGENYSKVFIIITTPARGISLVAGVGVGGLGFCV